jgi:hypothetical protein
VPTLIDELRTTEPNAAFQERHFKYSSCEELVLKEGQQFHPRSLTQAQDRAISNALAALTEPLELKECFANSQRLLFNLPPTYVYVEGYVKRHRAPPILHGWLHVDGTVIDPTVPPEGTSARDLSVNPVMVRGQYQGREYYGIPIPREYVREYVLKTKAWGTVIDNWEEMFPLLRDGLPWKCA